ncbi:MAG TPA: bifunctional glutamate N-acetyltransferase/amino-acid acetyltransferase ArgJ [bacterium]|nr:bifunctional glutamate N-acetyltransferase/amino-acid acetyltransferase ArgJ [bacterium]
MKIIGGSITNPKGFQAGAINCGIKERGTLDLTMITSDVPAVACGVFTTNKVCAAPVKVTREHVRGGRIQAVIINSGIANAATGKEGIANARAMALRTQKVLGLQSQKLVGVCSTGSIGKQLPIDKIVAGIETLSRQLSPDGGHDAARGIMTTDTMPKEVCIAVRIGGKDVIVGGIAKGAGMIYPNMATMLSFITTDAAISRPMLSAALKAAVNKSFNCISVDGDRSTNDTVLVLANGCAGNRPIRAKGADFNAFCAALDLVTETLAKKIVKDGEGATKFVEINVSGAKSDADAKLAANAVANYNLLKVAIYGENPNWGRIMAAVGASGAEVCEEKVSISISGRQAVKRGSAGAAGYDELKKAFKEKEITFDIGLGIGKGKARVWTCDFSHAYVDINV